MNSRGQSLTFVKSSVDKNIKYEDFLIDYIKDTFNIILEKQENIYKHYDFNIDKNIKIEYKGLSYKLDKNNREAVSNKGVVIKNAMIGRDKILYYLYRKLKNPSLSFYVIYGFYNVNISNENVDNIAYRIIDITDILGKIIKEYKQITYFKAKYFLIPIEDLQRFKKCSLFDSYTSAINNNKG